MFPVLCAVLLLMREAADVAAVFGECFDSDEIAGGVETKVLTTARRCSSLTALDQENVVHGGIKSRVVAGNDDHITVVRGVVLAAALVKNAQAAPSRARGAAALIIFFMIDSSSRNGSQ